MADHQDNSAYRSELEKERARLVGELSEIGPVEYDSNFADTSQVTAERGEAEALATELKDTLGEVDEALERLEAGTYGLCTSCGELIPEARLQAMPAASRCITCASKH
jgi:RNA polymerase-binding transcription factor DksA